VKSGPSAIKALPPGKNSPMLDSVHINNSVEQFAGLEGRALIRATVKAFPGKVALLSSFGAESSVLLHMVSEIDQSLPVIFLDTEKLFPETLAYRDTLVSEFGLKNIRNFHPSMDDLREHDPHGDLNQRDKDLCCHIRKTLPMRRALSSFDVVISGRKRFHGATRTDLQYVTEQDGKLKIEPLAGYSALDLQNYMISHQLPSHPLKLQGYRSIGCVPCTVVGGSDLDPRAGRWVDTDKTECGIHFSVNGEIIRTETRVAAGA
jgi:phosphoadenosine phosphosulfate reductase